MAVDNMKKRKFQLANHPWMGLGIKWFISIIVLFGVIIIANLIGIPGDAPYRPLITPTFAHILILFLVTPFVLQLPNGKTTYRKYIDDIRLSHFKPFLPLLILGISSSIIMLLLLSINSFVFRIIQGLPINIAFVRPIIDLGIDLPPESKSWIAAFPSIFEEISWRGVVFVLFMRKYSAKKSILITALGFGLFHLLNLLGGVEIYFVLRQVIFGSALGFFYGYLVLRTNSLLPAMLFHFLVNMFIGSFTHYFQRFAPANIQILYTLINLPMATLILIGWVKIFTKWFVPEPAGLRQIDRKKEK